MSVVTDKTTYKQTTVAAPTAPSTSSMFDLNIMAPLIREKVSEQIIDEPKINADYTAASSLFTGSSLLNLDNSLLDNLQLGQEVKVLIKKDQNPMSLFAKSAISYKSVDDCHDQIEMPCNVTCLNTLPSFEYITFRWDTEYSYGVRACDRDKDFWDFNFFTEQYALSRQAELFGRENDLLNTVIKGLIAAPATTVDAKTATAHATQYWSGLGTVEADYQEVGNAVQYMFNAYNVSGLKVLITQEFARDVVKALQNTYIYQVNSTNERVNSFEKYDIPGYMVADGVKEALGLSGAPVDILIVKRSPWLVTSEGGALKSEYPLWNADGTKQYVAVIDPRVGYQVSRPDYQLNIQPYDCDHLIRGMIDIEMVASGITFPQFGLVLEFNASEAL